MEMFTAVWFVGRRNGEMKPLDLWILLVLKSADGWIHLNKVMAVIFLLEKTYGLTNTAFRPNSGIPWSIEVEIALKKLTSFGLVDELPEDRGYRLGEKGHRVVRKIPIKDPKWRAPYSTAEFFTRWNIRDLAEYIRANYPEYVVNRTR